LDMINTRTRRGRSGERGFTLIELLVVLVILGLISVIAVPRVMNFLGGAKTDTAKIQIDRLAGILEIYRLDAGHYPSSEEGLKALVERPANVERWRGPYVDSVDSLVDPWGRPYIYEMPGDGRPFDLRSLGADGQPGGTDEDGDLAL